MAAMQTAQLITPEGDTISLPPDVYEAVLNMLEERRETACQMPRAKLQALIREMRGKYAGERSLVEALLVERAKERAEEARRDRAIAERFFK
ncbi:MAG TPA: hypothetical protein EYP55_02435 [Anaerolineae bacterium]|nr:hypothetical protein [Anaerolineae bacterium]